MNWKMWQKCVGKMGKKLPIFLFIFILLYVIGSLICYPMLTKRHALKQKEKYAEQAAKETVDRNASVRCLDDNTQALAYRLALIDDETSIVGSYNLDLRNTYPDTANPGSIISCLFGKRKDAGSLRRRSPVQIFYWLRYPVPDQRETKPFSGAAYSHRAISGFQTA